MAIHTRSATREVARTIFDEGYAGIAWWSTLKASWTKVTLFAERVRGDLALLGEPQKLTIDHPSVREADEAIGLGLAKGR